MKKIRISENELVDLIEKLVKENLGFGNGQNFGLMGTPTSKYKDLLEKEDIEEDDITDNEEEVSEETLNLNMDDETQDGLNQEKYMESISESQIIKRLSKKLHEDKRWIQDVSKEMDRDGTKGAFGDWCRSKGYKNGCSEACIEEGRRRGGVWQERADLAHTLCGFDD